MVREEVMHGDSELIKGCRKGDRVMQKALYDTYSRKMMAICSRYAASTEEAEDALQEGFTKVFKNIESFRSESSLSTWMTRIMINCCLNLQRQRLYMMPMVSSDDVVIPENEEIALSQFHYSELIAVIQSLPHGCRVVFNMFEIEGYSHKEISESLGVSEGTSKSQLNRAKVLLKVKLSERRKEFKRYGE